MLLLSRNSCFSCRLRCGNSRGLSVFGAGPILVQALMSEFDQLSDGLEENAKRSLEWSNALFWSVFASFLSGSLFFAPFDCVIDIVWVVQYLHGWIVGAIASRILRVIAVTITVTEILIVWVAKLLRGQPLLHSVWSAPYTESSQTGVRIFTTSIFSRWYLDLVSNEFKHHIEDAFEFKEVLFLFLCLTLNCCKWTWSSEI